MSVVVFAPDVENPSLQLNIKEFMGTWHVTHSTLSLWKSKKDVTITYENLSNTTSSGDSLCFDDTVHYRSIAASPTSSLSRVVGVDRLLLPSKPGLHGPGTPPTRFKWRGKGWLKIASSRWQILGCSSNLTSTPESSGSLDVPWVVTYFEKTIFTSAGLDIYSRSAEGLPAAVVDEIIAQVKALGGDIGKLADTFFEVHSSSRT